MKIKARIVVDIEIDSTDYIMPVDDIFTEEIIDTITTTLYDIEGVNVLNATAIQKK